MHVHPRYRFFDGADVAQVCVAGKAGMDASLQAYLGGSCSGRLYRAARHFFVFEIVGWAAQVPGPAALGECAEATVVLTDVRVVDVAVDDEGNGIADRFVA